VFCDQPKNEVSIIIIILDHVALSSMPLLLKQNKTDIGFVVSLGIPLFLVRAYFVVE
jgi:hypothetical protein